MILPTDSAMLFRWRRKRRRPGIPVDRLLREKALDLYRFIEKVVRSPEQVKIRRKVTLGDQAEKILGVVKEEASIWSCFPFRKHPFPLI